MATVKIDYQGNGTQTLFSFPFTYFDASDVKVAFWDDTTKDYTDVKTQGTDWSLSTATTVLFVTAPPAPTPSDLYNIRIYRETNNSSIQTTYYPGSAIRATDLNDNFTQVLYVSQESDFDASDARSRSITANTTADTAATNAATALSAANTATTNATTATTTANSANTTALAASSTASTANSTANTALTNSTAAQTSATNAVNTANAASTTATSANTTAATASTNASNAVTTANNASTLATSTAANTYTKTEADNRYFRKNTNSIESTETWTNSDNYLATTHAIENRIISLVDDVGGFLPISDHTSFPTSNPDINNDFGTVVSIQDITGLTHSSGNSTNALTTDTTSVTITNIPSSLPSPAGATGMLVVTTGTTHTYSFHRLLPAVADTVAVANNAANITTVAGQITPTNNIVAVANISSDVSTVAGNSANVTTVAGNNSNVTTVASNVSNVNTVSSGIANVNTVGSNISSVNTAATNISAITAAPTHASNASTSATNAASSATAAATSATNAAASVNNINSLSHLLNYGLITQTAGSPTDYGSI